MSIVIKSENISKLYRLGIISTRSIAQDMSRFIARVRGKEDPYMKVGEINFREKKSAGQFVWALKDINFEIRSGEIIGIIGNNGAGKSTLLKILSRVTTPTTGNVKIKGRVASLLEVGTGFHQDLSGKENIFLNGSILGMTKNEIKSKYDEIVDFSGVEKFIDTPVKRYSSGMYVRLAFAVAAYLEPEILIVDEVLAVGDAEFQKKCLGKMHDVSANEGRTVIFVSHNMGAVKNLCTSSILLERGMIKNSGNTESIIEEYLNLNSDLKISSREYEDKNSDIFFKRISVIPGNSSQPSTEIDVKNPFKIEFVFAGNINIPGLRLGFSIYSKNGMKILYDSKSVKEFSAVYENISGDLTAEVIIPGLFLAPGSYFINAALHIENVQLFDSKENAIGFNIIESGSGLHRFTGKDMGVVIADFKWNCINENLHIK
ncbi:MAG TPA: ABC transporter ATP-binding protein [Ignavibacteria bacterium]|nr:ABC transporter ATP-binding protein [Ignavibacteria bacterium]